MRCFLRDLQDLKPKPHHEGHLFGIFVPGPVGSSVDDALAFSRYLVRWQFQGPSWQGGPSKEIRCRIEATTYSAQAPPTKAFQFVSRGIWRGGGRMLAAAAMAQSLPGPGGAIRQITTPLVAKLPGGAAA